MAFLRDGRKPYGARRTRAAARQAAPSRAVYGSIGGLDCEAVAGFAGRAIAGQEGAARVMRRRAAGAWLP
ncbi:hypothetical protein [Burkholderia sp. SIMBA_062]|uniref:hypothetical protein n=1 Tax=Burkholderia sp. SIMBA_062 TaxID=3085803 RepID=UPI00397A136B